MQVSTTQNAEQSYTCAEPQMGAHDLNLVLGALAKEYERAMAPPQQESS